MASSGTGPSGDGLDGDGTSGLRNPLICGVCQDYYHEPCLLCCFHTFCARCLRNTQIDGKITCPLCGQVTHLKEGSQMPPMDQLMRQLVEIANSENPACANCDKRDKSTMFFCTTCGQALCTHCREHTHRAKMFSSHEVIHMSKCTKDTQRRCSTHGELYIMYSQSNKSMLCATCFRETPSEARIHCVDIDTAWHQASKKMERAANSICEIQAGVRDGVIALKSQLDELKHSLEGEKRALNTYCQVIQETIGKTHSSIISELQRQFENKDRMVRAQLINLGSALPVLQIHLMLCTVFTSGATKYQFLELAHPMLERLGRVAQLGHPSRPSLVSANLKINYKSEFSRSLQSFFGNLQGQKDSIYDHTHGTNQNEPQLLQSTKTTPKIQKLGLEAGPFSNHCRTFDTQLKELSQQLITVKERLSELHRDVAMLRRANTPPLGSRYDHVARDCRLLEQQLEHHQVELERLRNIFDALWEEQLCKIHIEKEIFLSQMNDILTLRGEVKQLQTFTEQLEPFVKSFSAGITAGEMSAAAADAAGHQHLQALLDHFTRIQMQDSQTAQNVVAPPKDCRYAKTTPATDNVLYMKESKDVPTRSRTPLGGVGALLDSGGNIIVYGTAKSSEAKRGVLSQLIEKARTREDRKKSPGREDGARDRSQTRRSRKSPDQAKPKTPPGHTSSSKVRSLYRTLKGGSGGGGGGGGDRDTSSGDIVDHEDKIGEAHPLQHSTGTTEESEYQRISDASTLGDAKKSRVQAQIHAAPQDESILQQQQQQQQQIQSQTSPATLTNLAQKSVKVYPASDSEDVFYGAEKCSTSEGRRKRRASCDSLSTTGSGNSRRSSIAEGTIGMNTGQENRKTLLVLIGSASKSKSTSTLAQKQRSWETFPRPKSKRQQGAGVTATATAAAAEASATGLGPLKKADSFEGHEEAVRTLVAAVQETRVQRHHHAHHHRHHRKSKTN